MVKRKKIPGSSVRFCMGLRVDTCEYSPYDTAESIMPSSRDLSSHRSVSGVYEDMSR